jgi:S-(hydroxymethyl)glutathione dehydrogenase / alcohol dehydrogenase
MPPSTSHEIKAALCRQFGAPLTIEKVLIEAPAADQVWVEVRACAICHSDISYARGDWGGQLPAIFGHEASGIVRGVGSGVKGFAPGDRVIATLIRHCGHCRYCDAGLQVQCEGVFESDRPDLITTPDGDPVWQAMRSGAFATEIVVHESQIAKIPDDLPFDQASLISCGVLTGYGAVLNTARVAPGSAVAVIGCGGVGLNAVQAACIAGAAPVIAIDLASAKREAAIGFGATHGLDPAAESIVKEVLELTGGRGVDHAFVTVGAKSAIELAPRLVAPGGTTVIIGMPASGVATMFDATTLAARSQKIVGSKMGDAQLARDVPAIVAAWRRGNIQLEELITGRYPLDRINEAMEAVVQGKSLRNVIIFD